MTEDNTKHPLRRPAVVGSILVGSVGLSALLTATQLGKVSTRNAEEDLDNLKTTPPETQRLVEKIQAEAAQIAATANQLETNISTLDSGQQAAVRRILNLDTAQRVCMRVAGGKEYGVNEDFAGQSSANFLSSAA